MRKFFTCFILCIGILFANVSTTHAVISETADLAISAAAGLMQTDDKKLEQEIIKGLQDPSEVENLRNYVEKTRPVIQDKTKFFNGTLQSALFFVSRVPIVGGLVKDAALSAYITMYENNLKEQANSDVIKKFVELREHNIDAGQGLFEVEFDFRFAQYDKDTSTAVVATDFTLLAAKGKQQSDRYKSSAASIATVLEAAGIAMQPEDIGDICIRSSKNSTPTNSTQPTQNSAPPVQTKPTPQNNVNATKSAPTGEHWIKDSNTGVYLWNPQPVDGETVSWSGGYVQDGDYKYANGFGTTTWRQYGNVSQVDEGSFERGRRHGEFKHQFFPSGNVDYSYWEHGVEK